MEDKGLHTLQLSHALHNNDSTRPFFDGIYSLDHLDSITQPPKMIVVNTDPSHKPGKHWLLFYRDSNAMEMYDSLGKNVDEMEMPIRRFVHRFNETVMFLNHRFQPKKTALCGHYCLYFAYLRCNNQSMAQIVNEMPSPMWIEKYVPILFNIPGIISECQTCRETLL